MAVRHGQDRMEDLGRYIRAERRRARLSLRQLSELSGISNPYLSQIERGLRRPSADILQQIARALDVPTEDLYVRAGILETPSAGDLVSQIWRDPVLADEHKKELEQLYLALRARAVSEAGEPSASDAAASK